MADVLVDVLVDVPVGEPVGDDLLAPVVRRRLRPLRPLRVSHLDRPPRPATLRRRLGPPLLAATALNVVLAIGDRLPAVDTLAYFETGRNFLGGRGYTRAGAPELHFPPLVPVSLRALELVTRGEMAALGTWNVLCAMAVVGALVALAHRLWHDDKVTVTAAWLAGMAAGLGPLYFRHGSGSEAVSLALLLWAVVVALVGLDDRSDARAWVRAAWLAGAGLLVGLSYLARPEALLPGALVGLATVAWTYHHAVTTTRPTPAFGALAGDAALALAAGPGAGDSVVADPVAVEQPVASVALAAGVGTNGGNGTGTGLAAVGSTGATVRGATLRAVWPSRAGLRAWLRGGVPVVAAFGIGVVVLVAPYALYLHANTGKWSLTAKTQDVSIEAWRAVAEGHRRERDGYLYKLNPDGTLGSDTQPLTALAAEHPRAWIGIVGINAREIGRVYLAPLWGYGPAWELLPAPLFALAGFELWRQRRRRGTLLLAGVALVPIATCLAFFTLPRYLTVPTAVLTLFAAKGLVSAERRLPKRWAGGLVATIAVLVAMSALTESRSFLPGGRTADPVDQKAAATWLEEHTPEDARVMTRSFHVQAYAHRPIVAMPVADLDDTLGFAREMGVRYLVIDSRSPIYPTLQAMPTPPELRIQALIGRSLKPIRIYELVPTPAPSDRPPIPLGYVGD